MTLRSCKYVLCKKHFMIIICLDDRDCQHMRFIVDSQFYTNYPHFTRCAEIYGIYALPHIYICTWNKLKNILFLYIGLVFFCNLIPILEIHCRASKFDTFEQHLCVWASIDRSWNLYRSEMLFHGIQHENNENSKN